MSIIQRVFFVDTNVLLVVHFGSQRWSEEKIACYSNFILGLLNKGNKREVRKMCKLMEDLQNEARDEGKKETLLDNIRSLMETMNLTAQQAMNALKIPADKQKEYVELI